jgi:hypothetical protein
MVAGDDMFSMFPSRIKTTDQTRTKYHACVDAVSMIGVIKNHMH